MICSNLDLDLLGVGSWSLALARSTPRGGDLGQSSHALDPSLLNKLLALSSLMITEHVATHESLHEHVQAEGKREKSSMLDRYLKETEMLNVLCRRSSPKMAEGCRRSARCGWCE